VPDYLPLKHGHTTYGLPLLTLKQSKKVLISILTANHHGRKGIIIFLFKSGKFNSVTAKIKLPYEKNASYILAAFTILLQLAKKTKNQKNIK